MNRHTFARIFSLILSLSLLLSACGGSGALEVSSSGGVRAWIDQPLTGSTLPLGVYTLIGHARGGVSSLTFMVNRMPVGSVNTDPSAELVTGQVDWNPSAPGEYTIQVQASGGSGAAVSEPAVVCVARPGQEAADCASYPPPAPLDNLTGSVTPGGANIIFKVDASPVPIIYGDCPQATSVLIFDVVASDTSQAVEVGIHAFVRGSGGEREFYYALNDMGSGSFSSSYPAGDLPISHLGGGSGTLAYRGYLMDANKTIYAESAEQTVPIQPCGAQSGGNIQFKVGAAPNPVYNGKCTPSVVTLEGYASDVSGAASVDFILSVVNSGGALYNRWALAATPASGGYLATYDVNSVPATFFNGSSGILYYELGLKNAAGEYYAKSEQLAVDILPCVGKQATTRVPQVKTTTAAPKVATTTVPPQVIITTAAPPVVVTTTVPPPQDTSGPQISKANASTGTAYYINGCGENSVTVGVYVSDPSGVKNVQVHFYYIPDKSGSPTTENIWDMQDNGSGSYSLTIMDPVSKQAYPNLQGDNGQLIYWFSATDGLGNGSQGGQGGVTVLYCPG